MVLHVHARRDSTTNNAAPEVKIDPPVALAKVKFLLSSVKLLTVPARPARPLPR